MNTEDHMSHRRGPHSRGFTLVESLAIIAILVVLMGLLARGIVRSRAQARLTESASNVRSLGSLLLMYSSDSRDMPPVFLSAEEGYWPPDHAPSVTIRGVRVTGFWFDHASMYYLAFDHPVPPRLIKISGVPWTDTVVEGPDGLVAPQGAYSLTSALYAEPRYWTRDGQRSPSQWIPQALGSISFPSSKGLIYQSAVDDPNGYVPLSSASRGVLSPVLWADSSASILEQATLRPGVPNQFDHYNRSIGSVGRAIAETQWGVRGRDK